MFEEALQKAPREELVEHIRLQRELIQRLHRRVMELEQSLEEAFAVAKCGDGERNEEEGRSSPTTVSPHVPSPRTNASAARAEDGGSTRMKPSPQAKPSPHGSSSFSTRPLPLASQQRLNEYSTDGMTVRVAGKSVGTTAASAASAAPEPRRTHPLPHSEPLHSSGASVTVSQHHFTDQEIPTSHPMSTTATVRLSSAAQHGDDALASPASTDHPTVLEGIKEINYVLAAHRAGRPALPLPVVEELEEIRGRLLRGFKQMCIDSEAGLDNTHAPARHIESSGDSALLRDVATSRIESIRQFYGSGRDGVSVDRVCPRWVSPESSRVVYGNSPRRRW